mmetsp:Transcript_1379/g.2514  ORF Transcript_1379/g.2514 Transcript_1379/m.2514 type:complete len:114 (-) Transcript_1379:135-476(-)|eukprot:CAMPEP_0182449756 /NCGR_PEP_ID=MMETSP1172-20130603/36446_1 /TAXON_ID=708627 /ORGANISM="Timspurckia oligopyrenoides, Strain CCMP3278" /LENGTH=113 /DNA_ID=CAMNT_0024647125 /DNA_START=54 /DNA_END=395 /DNA_ORIENTATION=-
MNSAAPVQESVETLGGRPPARAGGSGGTSGGSNSAGPQRKSSGIASSPDAEKVKFEDDDIPKRVPSARKMLRKGTPLPTDIEEQSREHRHQMEIWGEAPPNPEADKLDLLQTK